MKKSKVIVGIIAAVLSAILLCGCAGGGTAVGKKYDVIYDAVNDCTIALSGGKTHLFKNDKKVTKKGYYSIERIGTSAYDEYFVAKESLDGDLVLLKNDGTAVTLDYRVKEITGVEVNEKEDENGLTYTSSTEMFYAKAEEGDEQEKYLIKPNGDVFVYDYKYAKDLGGGLWKITYSTDNGADERVDVMSVDYGRIFSESSDSEYVKGYSFADDTAVFVVSFSTDNGTNLALYGKDGKIADGLIDLHSVTGEYGYVYDCGDLAAYAKETDNGYDVYKLDASLNSEKLSYKVTDIVFKTEDKVYVEEYNGNEDAPKVRVHEFGGEAKTDWFDSPVSAGIPYGIYAYKNGDTQKIIDYDFNELTSITSSETIQQVKYGKYENGYSLVVETDTDVYLKVFGVNRQYTLDEDEDEDVDIYDGFAEISKDNEVQKLVLADKVVTVSEYSNLNGVIQYKANGSSVAYLESDIPFEGRNNLLSGISFGGAKVVAGESEYGFVVGEVNGSDKAAFEDYGKKSEVDVYTALIRDDDKTRYTVIAYANPNFLGASKQIVVEGAATVSANGSLVTVTGNKENKTTVYELSGEGTDITMKEVMKDLSKNATVYTDILGNSYILDEVNDRTAIYGKDGKLLLDPKYNIAMQSYEQGPKVLQIANGNVVVKQGGYYGIVKLGKKASSAKLVKKIEYTTYKLMENGDYILAKTGEPATYYNAAGKAVVKDVVGLDYVSIDENLQTSGALAEKENKREIVLAKWVLTTSDGKDVIVTQSLKGKDTRYYRALFTQW